MAVVTARTEGSFVPGRDYDLVWATTPWYWADKIWIGEFNGKLQRFVEENVEGLVTTPKGYPREYAQRHLFRIRIKSLRSAALTIQEILEGGRRYARGCVFGHEGTIEFCAADLVDTWQDPDTDALYPSPCALEYAPGQSPEQPRTDWLPYLYMAGAVGAGLALWGVTYAIRQASASRPPRPRRSAKAKEEAP